MTTRCPACHAPAVIRAGRTGLAHLTWCPHAPQPQPTPLPDWTTTPDALDLDDPAVLAALSIIAAHDDDPTGEGGPVTVEKPDELSTPAVGFSLPPGGRGSERSSERGVPS